MTQTNQGQRAERVLDAAADLVLRWGYKRVTIEDVAKHAGIGKGTVYLHFRNRAALFTSVLARDSLAMTDQMLDRMRQDPSLILPAEQCALVYREVMRRPLLRALFSRDIDVLGDLMNDASVDPLRDVKISVLDELLGVLRQHGLVRADVDIPAQRYLIMAIQSGFYLNPPFLAQEQQQSDDAAADLLAYSLRAAVHASGSPDPDVLAALAPKVIACYDQLRAVLWESVYGGQRQGE
jgi:AcrR family transcriptional regulator